MALFYLIFFISIKLIGLHSFTHIEEADHDNDCVYCHVIDNNKEASAILVLNEISATELYQHQFNLQPFFEYDYTYTQTFLSTILFGRPPPTI